MYGIKTDSVLIGDNVVRICAIQQFKKFESDEFIVAMLHPFDWCDVYTIKKELAPSKRTFNTYKYGNYVEEGKGDFELYTDNYLEDLQREESLDEIERIVQDSENKVITIGCSCYSSYCHRFILAEVLREFGCKVEVVPFK